MPIICLGLPRHIMIRPMMTATMIGTARHMIQRVSPMMTAWRVSPMMTERGFNCWRGLQAPALCLYSESL